MDFVRPLVQTRKDLHVGFTHLLALHSPLLRLADVNVGERLH